MLKGFAARAGAGSGGIRAEVPGGVEIAPVQDQLVGGVRYGADDPSQIFSQIFEDGQCSRCRSGPSWAVRLRGAGDRRADRRRGAHHRRHFLLHHDGPRSRRACAFRAHGQGLPLPRSGACVSRCRPRMSLKLCQRAPHRRSGKVSKRGSSTGRNGGVNAGVLLPVSRASI